MRHPRTVTPALAPYLLLLLQPVASVSWDCKHVRAGGVDFDLQELGGPHQVSWVRQDFDVVHNTTFKIDLCKPLKLEDEKEKNACGPGTHICAVERTSPDNKLEDAFPIMRSYVYDGADFNPKLARLKDSESNADNKLEGVRLTIGGGKRQKQPQRAVIEFVCNKDRHTERDVQLGPAMATIADGENGGNDHEDWKAARKTDDGAGGSIDFDSYEDDTLRLNWHTPYGCEDAASSGNGGSSSSGGWGFFSWFFFIVFMGLLGFILFTAWINYSQHGARGWDLLPFSDTIRDVPYILGDWGRKIVSTLNGGGSRGGYSAV